MCGGLSKLRRGRFLPGSKVRLTSNAVFMKNVGKFGRFRPSELTSPGRGAAIILTSFRLFGGPMGIKDSGSPLSASVACTSRLMLRRGRSVFDLSITALGCTGPSGGRCGCGLRKFRGS